MMAWSSSSSASASAKRAAGRGRRSVSRQLVQDPPVVRRQAVAHGAGRAHGLLDVERQAVRRRRRRAMPAISARSNSCADARAEVALQRQHVVAPAGGDAAARERRRDARVALRQPRQDRAQQPRGVLAALCVAAHPEQVLGRRGSRRRARCGRCRARRRRPGSSEKRSTGASDRTHVSLLPPPRWPETISRSVPAMRDRPPGMHAVVAAAVGGEEHPHHQRAALEAGRRPTPGRARAAGIPRARTAPATLAAAPATASRASASSRPPSTTLVPPSSAAGLITMRGSSARRRRRAQPCRRTTTIPATAAAAARRAARVQMSGQERR